MKPGQHPQSPVRRFQRERASQDLQHTPRAPAREPDNSSPGSHCTSPPALRAGPIRLCQILDVALEIRPRHRNPATCGTHQGNWTRPFDPSQERWHTPRAPAHARDGSPPGSRCASPPALRVGPNRFCQHLDALAGIRRLVANIRVTKQTI